MTIDRIRYISAQPDELQFVWQTHVYLHNYLSLGLPEQNCVALFGVQPGQEPSEELLALQTRFPGADIRLYEDTRDENGREYSASIQPHLILKALRDSPEWEGELSFFQDCDIGFRRLPDFDRMLSQHPHACILSDTRDYIGFEHLHRCCEGIRAKRPDVPADELIHRMCEVVGIDVDVVRKNEAGSGGAQYLLQGVGRPYWEKVYRDSIAIHRLFDDYLDGLGLSKEPKAHIQTWTAGMWAYLWNLWLSGLETVLHPEMAFVFSGATSNPPAPILHMAGLPDELWPTHFDKRDWVEWNPIDTLRRQPHVFDHLPANTISREYAMMIRRAAEMEPRGMQPLTPARYWRVLAWKTESKSDIWDIDHLQFFFDRDTQVFGFLESGCAGEGFEAQNAFNADEGVYWGGRSDEREGYYPCFYLGVELDHAASPEKITLTQHADVHVARTVIVQFSHDGLDWETCHVASLDATLIDQPILYCSDAGHRSDGWRLVAHSTSSDLGWDVKRLRFLDDLVEERGRAVASGSASPERPADYGPDNAFENTDDFWGGRAASDDHYHLGIVGTRGLGVNRVLLEQRDEHWASRVEVQVLDANGRWVLFREVDNLGPGLNDILLF